MSLELKKAIRKLDDISNQTILLCKNNIETLEHIHQHQTLLQEQLNVLISKRLQCRNKMRRCSNDALKEQLKVESKSYTPHIQQLRKEVKFCDNIRKSSTRIQQFELNDQLMKTEKGKIRT